MDRHRQRAAAEGRVRDHQRRVATPAVRPIRLCGSHELHFPPGYRTGVKVLPNSGAGDLPGSFLYSLHRSPMSVQLARSPAMIDWEIVNGTSAAQPPSPATVSPRPQPSTRSGCTPARSAARCGCRPADAQTTTVHLPTQADRSQAGLLPQERTSALQASVTQHSARVVARVPATNS